MAQKANTTPTRLTSSVAVANSALNPYAPIDRSGLQLPAAQTCHGCGEVKNHTEFRLTRSRVLHNICRECSETNNQQDKLDAKRGRLVNRVRSGERVVSDRFLELITANNNAVLDQLLLRFIAVVNSATSADDFKLAFNLAQGSTPIIHLAANRSGKAAEPTEKPQDTSSDVSAPGGATDLLALLKTPLDKT
jgi:hypothetical protein